MRKRAWDYGRLALVNKDYEKYDFCTFLEC